MENFEYHEKEIEKFVTRFRFYNSENSQKRYYSTFKNIAPFLKLRKSHHPVLIQSNSSANQ